MNPFDEFDLDIVKITNNAAGPRSCDDPMNGSSGGGSSVMATLTVCGDCLLTEVTCPSKCRECSDNPKCQTLEGRCE